MRPETNSLRLLGITRSKAKMYEYGVPLSQHIAISRDPARLFPLSIGLLGDLSAYINGEDVDQEALRETQEALSFSARFFDAYLQAQLNNNLRPYLILLGSASYYLCNLPGSSRVLAQDAGKTCPDLGGSGLENFLHWLLQFSGQYDPDIPSGPFWNQIVEIIETMQEYYSTGAGEDRLFSLVSQLREHAYKIGTSKQLLFADICCAVIRKQYENSTWFSLPKYTGLSAELWSMVIRKPSFIKELWPAQHLLGLKNVYRGSSAVVQMPTSAGKTKATQIIIRSAFLAERTSLVIIVAPFRTLCYEIRETFLGVFRDENIYVDELSDVLQIDFSINRFLKRKQILIVTPEKLNYILHHVPKLGSRIGLLILDEGHQFDNGTRGITYELLITSLKEIIPSEAQKILISAVIRNADQVAHWLIDENAVPISGANLSPTFRSVGFTSWQDTLGRVWFVNPEDPEEEEFFVPRIIQQYQLQRFSKREKERFFPEKTDEKADGKDIAIYLGLRLVSKGSVAVFCGMKVTVQSICNRIVDIYNRNIPLPSPDKFSNLIEISKLVTLIKANMGENSILAVCAGLGVFAHHSNIPHGIRLSVEYALKEGRIRYVICTSTLAQGVNLPIRYLVVTTTYQGQEQISVRDFQNLIGRSGRSGMQTEGSILFSDPEIYDKKENYNEKWEKVKGLLKPENSKPCSSTLFSIFARLENDKKSLEIKMRPLDLVEKYIDGPEVLRIYVENIASQFAKQGFSLETLKKQVKYKLKIISAIESFLMSHLDVDNMNFDEEGVRKLAKGTLAYFLGDQEQKEQIETLFVLLAKNIEKNIPEPNLRVLFGKTLFGIHDALRISSWLSENLSELVDKDDEFELLQILWPILAEMIESRLFSKCNKPEILKTVAKGWILGLTFNELFIVLEEADARVSAKKISYRYKADDVVELCESAIAYEATLVLGAIIDFLELQEDDRVSSLILALQTLLKRLKYGLATKHSVILYECGFADRVVSRELGSIFEDIDPVREIIVDTLKQRERQVFQVLDNYPSYFSEVYRNLT
jgi:POLQ-like helicase